MEPDVMARLFRHPTDPPPASEFRVRRAGAAPLDLTDERTWSPAHAITWGADEYRTTFRALWSDEALLVRYDCRDRTPWWTIAERDGRLWDEEVVEIFLDPLRQGVSYAEVEVSPANVVCDLVVRTPWPSLVSDPAWDWCGLVSRVTTVPTANGVVWSAVVSLPFDGLSTLAVGVAAAVPPKAVVVAPAPKAVVVTPAQACRYVNGVRVCR
jgi:hypothetical protein